MLRGIVDSLYDRMIEPVDPEAIPAASDDTFEWPCDERVAHKPHEILIREYKDDSLFKDCPGVKAHPNTMIGRQS